MFRAPSSILAAVCSRPSVIAAVLAALLLGRPAPVAAQTPTATLAIEVRDATDAVMPDVTVMLTNRESGIGRRGTTNAQGTVVVSLLAPGTYLVAASRVGFKTELIRDVRLQASVKSTLSIVLEAGTVDEHVDVTANRTTLVAGDSAVGEVIDRETMASLPVLERDALQFAQQAPGVAPPAPGSRLSTQGNVGLNVAGAREASNNFLLDGVDNNDLFLNRLVVNPSLDAIEEVSLLQNTYDAAYGRSAGGQVNMVVRSGTSDLKGSAYEYFRHSSLDARNSLLPDDNPEPRLRKHQFGGTLGGPIGHWPSFFFTNVEVIDGIEADTRLAHVPTAAERAGDFSASGVTLIDPFTQRPFPGNVLPASRIDPVGARLMALYPAPNHADEAANLVSSPEGRRNGIQATIKTDHHGWHDRPIQVRYTYSREDRDLPFPTRSRNLPGFGVAVLDEGHQFSASISRTSGRLFHETRFGLNALDRDNAPQSAGVDQFAALGITPPPYDPSDRPGVSHHRRARLRDARRRHQPAGAPADPHPAPVRDPRRRPRPSPRQDRRRAASLQVGRLQPPVLARPGRLHRRVHRPAGRRHAARLSDHHAARRQRQPAGAAHLVGERLRAGRLARLVAPDDQRRACATSSTRRRWTPTIAWPSSTWPRGRCSRWGRTACRAPASTRTSTTSRRGSAPAGISPAAARWCMRGGYGLFYDSGTLIENSALYFNPPYWQLQLFFPSEQGLILDRRPVPDRHRPSHRADDQHHRPRLPHRLRAAGEPRPGARVHLVHRCPPATSGRSATATRASAT